MSKHVLLLVETNPQAQTDTAYINETIRYYYDLKKSVFRIKELGSKTRFRSPKVINEIKEFCKYAPEGDAVIVYCIDVDNYNVSPETRELLNTIRDFCNSNGFELVLFNNDIENVYWKEHIHKNDKKKKAQEFIRKKLISTVAESNLRKDASQCHCSNILTILDNYCPKKE